MICAVLYADLPTPKYFCQYTKQPKSVFSDFLPDFLRMHHQSVKTKQCQRSIFSIIYLVVVRRMCQLTSSIIQAHYTQMTLFCLLYICESHSRSKTAEHILQKQCTVCAVFANADASFLERLLSGQSLFPWFHALFLLIAFMQPLITNIFEVKPST